MFKKNILVCENYIDENGVEWYNVKYLKLFAKESKFMKKMRILALVIAILSVAAMLFLVSCKDDAGKKGDCSVTGEHRWNAWKSNGDATCTEDGTKSRRCPICNICVYPALVQGDGAAEDIARAIEEVNLKGDCDTIIVGRGGGSIEDLWAFNEEIVAMAIYKSSVPVISAVGHETDFTIADFVSDLRAPTPSAAAELAVPAVVDIKGYISGINNRLNVGINSFLSNKRYQLKAVCSKISVQGILSGYNQKRMYIDSVLKKAEVAVNNKVYSGREALSVAAAKLHALSPLAVMSRGYSAVFKDGKTITKLQDIQEGDNIKIYLQDGIVSSTVTEKEKTKWLKK